jgi:hypothetical protein
MKIDEIKAFVKNCVTNNVAVPALLVGTMGCGKSQIMAQVASELGIGLVDLRLAQQEAGDLIGLPYQVEGVTHYARPEWFPKEGTKGIIFLDELNRAPTDVRQAVFQLVLDRRIHTHRLPDGWFVHAAINPDNGNYQVETLDPAMMRRFCTITVDPDVDTWLAWAKGVGKIDNTLTEFVNTNRALLFQPEEIKIDVKPTPDSYRMLDVLMRTKVIAKENQMEIFKGLIGKEAGVALIKWLDTNYKKPVSGTQILAEYDKWAAKVKKQETAENYATTMDLVALVNPKKGLTDLELKNMCQFMLDIPKESQTALIAKLATHIRTLLFKDQRISKLLMSIVEQ